MFCILVFSFCCLIHKSKIVMFYFIRCHIQTRNFCKGTSVLVSIRIFLIVNSTIFVGPRDTLQKKLPLFWLVLLHLTIFQISLQSMPLTLKKSQSLDIEWFRFNWWRIYDDQPQHLPRAQQGDCEQENGQRNVIAARIANQLVSGRVVSNVVILTQNNRSQYQNPTSTSSTATLLSDWCTEATNLPNFIFTENVGFLIPITQDVNPGLFFNLFLTNEIVIFIADNWYW